MTPAAAVRPLLSPHAWTVLALTAGGALGVNARYWLGALVARWFGSRFPWATVGINVTGSFAIGLAAMVLAERRWGDPHLRIFAITGFLGGYTTFSSYMLETITLWERGDRREALANLVGSVALGLAAVLLGVALGRRLASPRAPTPTHEARVERRVEAVGAAEAGREPLDAPAA